MRYNPGDAAKPANTAAASGATSDSDACELDQDSPLRRTYQVPGKPQFVLVGLFGLDHSVTAAAAGLVDAEMRRFGVVPIYVTDAGGIEPLRCKQRVFEVLPNHWASYQAAPDLDWSFYLRRRYLLLLEKWRPIGLVVFGHHPVWLPSAEIFDVVHAGQSGAQPCDESAADGSGLNAMTQLGVLAETGVAGAPDLLAASQLYLSASALGDDEASYRLGRLYRDGKGVPQDESEARRLFEAAVNAGVSGAEKELAELYERGRGGPHNKKEALRLYQIAAKENPWAARAVGRLYATGDPIAKDLSEAAAWFRKAALAGVGWASWDLARLYEAAQGIEPVPGEVARWYALALAQGARDGRLQELARHRLENLPRATLVAGAQLLLKDIGYDIGAVDGLLGPSTLEAIQSFFAKSSTDEMDITPDLLTDLARHWRAGN